MTIIFNFGGGGVFLCIIISIISILVELWCQPNSFPYRYVSDSNELLPILTAICSFMYFKNIQIPQHKWINIVGGSTFGVLLIHANSDTMRKWIWKDTLDNAGHYNDELFWLYPIIAVIVIFFICIVIDRIRIMLIEKPTFNFLNKTYKLK